MISLLSKLRKRKVILLPTVWVLTIILRHFRVWNFVKEGYILTFTIFYTQKRYFSAWLLSRKSLGFKTEKLSYWEWLSNLWIHVSYVWYFFSKLAFNVYFSYCCSNQHIQSGLPLCNDGIRCFLPMFFHGQGLNIQVWQIDSEISSSTLNLRPQKKANIAPLKNHEII